MGANGSKAPRSPNKPSVLQHENSLTDTIRRVVSKHGDSTKKISEKRDFRQSLAKAQLEVRLRKRRESTSSKSPPDGDKEEEMQIAAKKKKHKHKGHHVKKHLDNRKQKREKKLKKRESDSQKKNNKKWPLGWSKLGVSIRFLHTMYSRVKGSTTTREVVEHIVRIDTEGSSGHGSSYVEFLAINEESDFHGNLVTGQATHYVSHAWDSPFSDLVSALDVMISTDNLNPALVFFWIDAFSLHQHEAHINQRLDDVEIKTRDAIKNIDHVVLVLGPWDTHLALNRTWCLWEILCALSAKKHLEVFLPGKALFELHNSLLERFPEVCAALTTINYKETQCSEPSVFQRIISAIDSVGEKRATRALEKSMRKWLIRTSSTVLTEMMHHEVSKASKGSRVDRKKALRLAEDLGDMLRHTETFKEAEKVCRTALSLREMIYGKDHDSTIVSMQNLAQVVQGLGNAVEAEVFYRRALVVQEESLGMEDEKTLLSVNNFAVFCQKQGKHHESENLYRRAIEGFEKNDGPHHAHTLLSMHNLASLLQLRKQFPEAEALYRRVLEGRIETLGLKDRLTLQTLNRLGTVCHDLGKSEEAVGIFMCALEGREETLGPDHRQTLQTVSDLASCLLDGESNEQSKQYFERAMTGRIETLGKHHEDTLRSICDLGACLYQMNDSKESERLQRKALRGREKVLGPDHVDTLRSVSNLAAVCYSEGKLKEAERLYKRALAGFDKTIGRKDPITLLCVDTLARLLKAQGKIKAAIPLYERALKGYSETLGPNARDTLNTLGNMGLCLKAAGQVSKGDHMIRKAVELMEHDESLKDHRSVKKFEIALQQSKELVLENLLKNVQDSRKKDGRTGSKTGRSEDASGKKTSKGRSKSSESKKKQSSTSESKHSVSKEEKRRKKEQRKKDKAERRKSKEKKAGRRKKKGEEKGKKSREREEKQGNEAASLHESARGDAPTKPPTESPPAAVGTTSETNGIPKVTTSGPSGDAVLTMPQTKIYPAAASKKPGSKGPADSPRLKPASPQSLPVFDQLQAFEKLAKQTKAEALKLKSEGDVKGALAKLSEYKRMQVELTQKRKERIAELRARLAKNKEKDSVSGPAKIANPNIDLKSGTPVG